MNLSRKRLPIYLGIACLVWAWSIWFPVHNRATQMVSLAAFSAVMILGLASLPDRWRFRAVVAVQIVLALVALSISTVRREIDQEGLRESLVVELERQEGRDYVWGGEGVSGVDCSGLARRAYRLACVKQGVVDFNPGLWRLALGNWLFDASAEAMKDGYRKGTFRLDIAPVALTDLDHERVLPGDLAVTTNGVHLLAYLGDHRWIQADPGAMEVLIEDARDTENPWMQVPVKLLRWSAFDEG